MSNETSRLFEGEFREAGVETATEFKLTRDEVFKERQGLCRFLDNESIRDDVISNIYYFRCTLLDGSLTTIELTRGVAIKLLAALDDFLRECRQDSDVVLSLNAI